MGPGLLYAIMPWIESLNNNSSRKVPSARSASNLSQQLKRPLACAKIGKPQGCVCGYNSHQCDPGQIMALCNHLSADEYIDLSTFETLQYYVVRVLPCCGVSVHSGNPRIWEEFLYF